MAQPDYVGSLAQTGISYTTLITIQTVPGQNYYQIGLFVDSVVDAPSNLIAGYAINTPIAMNPSNYTTYVVANSRLYGWLTNFFQINSTSTVYVVPYNGVTHDIPSAHAALLTLAYFKMVFFGATETSQYNNDVVNLSSQQAANTLLTQTLVGTSNPLILLASGSGGGGTIDLLIRASGYDAMVAYSAVTSFNELFSAIGLALSYSNPTGTPVGNTLDYDASPFLVPSTGTANVNLTPAQTAILTQRNVGYFATSGDGSGNVYLNNRFSILGQVVGAKWLVNYCNFICALKTATLITTGSNYTFKNNSTYQMILSIINSVISPFQNTSLARLSNYQLSAPPFAQLPVTGGTVLTIPNAWSAIYNDRIGSVNVNGTLSITL